MADPLSIAASVAGLIALSGSIYKIIGNFVKQAVNPPQSAHALLLTISEMRMVLKSVSVLVDDFLKYPPKRRALVRLDHLILCLTQMVLSFAELEKFVNAWATRTQRSIWQRWTFISVDERISRFDQRLQENKASMSLVLNILQCESDIDAQQYRLSLHEMMERIINENKEIRTRVDELGSLLVGPAPSITTTFGLPGALSSVGSVTGPDTGDDGSDDASTIRRTNSARFSTITHSSRRCSTSLPIPVGSVLDHSASLSEPNFHRPFEDQLAQSWVYTRVRRNECDISFTSQNLSGLWSMLSDLSLSQISNISVIALPITLNDLPNGSWYKESTRLKINLLESSQAELSTDISLRVDRFYNIAVLGECDVGKSTLIMMLCGRDPKVAERYTTFSIDYYKSICVDNTECRLRITDTPGLGTSNYSTMIDSAIQYAEAFVLVYSVADRDSFSRIQSLYDEILRIKRPSWDERPPVVIIANKIDSEKADFGSAESASSLARKLNCGLFQCSISHHENIFEAFIELIRCIPVNSPCSESLGENKIVTRASYLGLGLKWLY